jgi:hypothetical protein
MHDRLTALHETVADMFRHQILFIGAAARSGTTWLQLMLNAHPGISCCGEGHFCDSLLPLLDQALTRHNALVHTKNATLFQDLEPFPRLVSTQGQYLLAATIALMLAEAVGDAAIVGEKASDNVLAVPQLRTPFPAARFIFVLRDGRDCATSAWSHNQRVEAKAMREKFPRFDDFIDAFVRGWVTCTDTALRQTASDPQHCVCVSCEALVRTPEATLSRLFTFLGAEADPATVHACVEAAAFPRLTGGRRPGQEDRSSLFHRGEIGDWHRHFSADTCAIFECHGGALLQRLGHARPMPRPPPRHLTPNRSRIACVSHACNARLLWSLQGVPTMQIEIEYCGM